MTTTIQVLLLVTALVLIVVNSVLRNREPAKLKRHIKYLLSSLKREQNTLVALEGRAATEYDDRRQLQKGVKRLMNCLQWLATDNDVPNEVTGKFYDLAHDKGLHMAMEYYDGLRANRPGKPVPKNPKEAKELSVQDKYHRLIEQYFKENPPAKTANESLNTPFTHEELWRRLGEQTKLDILRTLPDDPKAVKVADKLVTIQGTAEIC